ncbi:hypothetical protein Tco_1050348 [Tanacetum coccineum]
MTQFEKKRDKIAALHKVTFKECVQCLETASGFVVTLSELTSDGVKTFVTASKRNCLNETLEDSAKRRCQDSYDALRCLGACHSLGSSKTGMQYDRRYREVPSFDEPEPQPQPLPSCPSLDESLGEERGHGIFDEKKHRSS